MAQPTPTPEFDPTATVFTRTCTGCGSQIPATADWVGTAAAPYHVTCHPYTALAPRARVGEAIEQAQHELTYATRQLDSHYADLLDRVDRLRQDVELARSRTAAAAMADNPRYTTVLDEAAAGRSAVDSFTFNARFDLIAKYAAQVDAARAKLTTLAQIFPAPDATPAPEEA